MLLTKECEYGMRVIRALSSGRQITVKEVAKKESIPEPFAYKIVEKLRAAGYLENRRGRDGGIRLLRELDTLTLFNIVSAIDSERYIIKSLHETDKCLTKSNKMTCKFHKELSRIQQVFMDELKSRTIKDILAV